MIVTMPDGEWPQILVSTDGPGQTGGGARTDEQAERSAAATVDRPSGRRVRIEGQLDFRLLGPLDVVRNGRPCPLAGTRAPAVLAMLLLSANHTVSVECLARGVWVDPPRGARSNVRTYIAQLRHAFGTANAVRSVLTTQAGGYRLNVHPDDLDVMRFAELVRSGERALRRADPISALHLLERALGLWRGEALAGVTHTPLLATEAARLEQWRLATIERWAEAGIAAGRHHDVVAELTRLVHAQPLREHAWAHLMLALYRSGCQGQALTTYREAHRLLDRELGITPGNALQRLHHQILTHDPTLDPPLTPTASLDRAAPPPRALAGPSSSTARRPPPPRPGH